MAASSIRKRTGKSMKIKRSIISILILLFTAGLIFSGLYYFQPEIAEKDDIVDQIMVPVIDALFIEAIPQIELSGRVQAEGNITLFAQSDGEIQFPDQPLKEGDVFKAGQILFLINSQNALVAYSQAKARVAQANQQLKIESESAIIAKKIWQQTFSKNSSNILAARELQVESARAVFAAEQASLLRAEEILNSTRFKAPYNGYVSESWTEPHQYVNVGTRLAEIYPISHFVIPLPISINQLNDLLLPLVYDENYMNLTVDLSASIAGKILHWPAEIVRSNNKLDPVTRVALLTAKVDRPLDRSLHAQPLVTGLFVKATITGAQSKNVAMIPKTALQQNNRVFSLDENNQLVISQVKVIKYQPLKETPENYVMVEGLKIISKIINKTLTNVVSGAILQPVKSST